MIIERLNDANFNDNLPFVSKVEFGVNSFRKGSEGKTYTIDGDEVITKVDRESYSMPLKEFDHDDVEMDKDTPITGLAALNIGEWRREYAPTRFDVAIRDGFSWYLNLYFSNGAKPVKIDGCNSYPYNFAKLLELFDYKQFTIENLK